VVAEVLGVLRGVSGGLLLEALRITLVQLGAQLLRHRVVGGVADEDVVEAKAVVARKEGVVGAHELLAHQPHKVSSYPTTTGWRKQLRDRAWVEQTSLDRGTHEHGALVACEPVDARGEQGLDRGRDGHIGIRIFGVHCKDLLDEEWVALGCLNDARACLAAQRPSLQ